MTRVQSGRKSQFVGANFEAWIESQHIEAQYLGLLFHVIHNSAQTKFFGGRLVFVGAGVADYTGCLVGGKTMAAEAKSTASLRLTRAAIEPKQALHLDAVARAGGLALLLVEFRMESTSSRFAVPWQSVPWVKLQSADSVCAADLAAWKIVDQCYLSRFCPPGVSGSVTVKHRIFPRE